MAIKGVIQSDKLAKAVMANLQEYAGEVGRAVEIAAEKNAKLGVKLLKSNSPKLTGSYATGWRAKKIIGTKFHGRWVIHNATDYQLTHLLEKSHALVNGGRSTPQVHIAPVEKFLIETFEEDVREAVKG